MPNRTIEQLQIGDLVDLAGDQYADPHRSTPWLDYQFAEVVEIERETDYCIAVSFEGFDIVGFPPQHIVYVEHQ